MVDKKKMVEFQVCNDTASLNTAIQSIAKI